MATKGYGYSATIYNTPFTELRDDIFKGESVQKYRKEDGGHLYYDALKEIKRQESCFDRFCKDYYGDAQGDINPLQMKKLAVEYVRNTCGDNRYVQHNLV